MSITSEIDRAFPLSVHDITYPVATSHILIVLSRDADSTKSPAGKKATEETLWS